MERMQRVGQLWSWLPAFRAVAEAEHLRRAAEQLHISPSALSRTVGLVESDVGTALFRRVGRGIVLTRAGAALLEATRDAMRLVHDALTEIGSGIETGQVRIAAPGTVTRMFVLPALARVRADHPKLEPALDSRTHAPTAQLLRRGDLDVAFTIDPVRDEWLTTTALGRYGSGVYCGRTHPLFPRAAPTLEEVTAHPFVAPPVDARGRPREGWPVDLPRQVDTYATDLDVGVDICRSGTHLVVLPDRIAAIDVERGSLRRLPLDVVPPTPFFATHRPTLRRAGAVESLVEAVADAARADES